MLPYNRNLKQPARQLRSNMTDAERRLWARLRGKQILGVQFYRQKPLGNSIVDFYAPKAHLVIEVDGSQHFELPHRVADAQRTAALAGMGLRVLRFTANFPHPADAPIQPHLKLPCSKRSFVQ